MLFLPLLTIIQEREMNTSGGPSALWEPAGSIRGAYFLFIRFTDVKNVLPRGPHVETGCWVLMSALLL